ncbi:MAG: hypothetical protein GX224_02985 [Thermoplasmatales archaeon]|nr:hypothetical protein [Thermoplasmatales archaeon]
MADRYVSVAEVREMLRDEEGRREEIPPIQRYALTLAQATSEISGESARAMRKELLELEFMTKHSACKISDLLPRHPRDVRAIFHKERVNLEASDIDAIIEIVGKYL